MSNKIQARVQEADSRHHQARRILLHLTASPYGGVETHVYYLSQELAKRGAEVTLVSQRRFDLNEEWTRALIKSGVRIVAPLPIARRLPGALGLLLNRLYLVWKLSAKSFDRVVGQGHGGAFAWMKRFTRTDGLFLWHEHWYGLPTRGDEYPEYRTPLPTEFSWKMQRMVSRVNGIITGCERARSNLIEVQNVRAPIRIIPPLDYIETIPEAEEKCYDASSTLRFVMVARLGRGKGGLELLNVWNELRIGPAELHFYGPVSDEFQPIAELYQRDKQIHFHGPFKRDDLASILQSSDVGLMLSVEEGYGLAAWEYMACGLPFVMTDCGAAREFTEDNPDALRIPVSREGLVSGLEEMVTRLRSGAISRRRLQRFFKERFSFETNIREYVEALLGPSHYWQD
jgi:glycosyltransferase involved in cell wall biosynthesis